MKLSERLEETLAGIEELTSTEDRVATERLVVEAMTKCFEEGRQYERRIASEHVSRREMDLRRILAAWFEPGPAPHLHRSAQRKVRRLMPVLVQRIERVADR